MAKKYGSFIPPRMKDRIKKARKNDSFLCAWKQAIDINGKPQIQADIRNPLNDKVWPEFELLLRECPRGELFSQYLKAEDFVDFFRWLFPGQDSRGVSTDPEIGAYQRWRGPKEAAVDKARMMVEDLKKKLPALKNRKKILQVQKMLEEQSVKVEAEKKRLDELRMEYNRKDASLQMDPRLLLIAREMAALVIPYFERIGAKVVPPEYREVYLRDLSIMNKIDHIYRIATTPRVELKN